VSLTATICVAGLPRLKSIDAESSGAIRPTLPNAIEHLRATLNLREEIVERRSPEGVFQCGFVVYKSVLAAASNIVILIQRVLP